VILVVGHFVLGLKILAPKLIDLKTALVDVKMYIALFKIGSAGLPNHRLGMKRLHRQPRAVSDAAAVRFGRNEKNLQLVVMRLLIDFQYNTAHLFAVNNDTVGLVLRIVNTALNGLS